MQKTLYLCLVKIKNSFNIKSLMREPYFIPESKDVDELLADLRRDNIQMAIARDEYGGTAGLVTLEDLLEEIVGEIRDEYDVEEPLIQIIDENSFHVNARMRVDELNEQMGLNIPESEDYGTVGGYVFDLFGHQPTQDDCISDGGLTFIAERMDSGRIESIRILKASDLDPGQTDELTNNT